MSMKLKSNTNSPKMALQNPRFHDQCRLCATKTESIPFVHIFKEPYKELSQKIESCLQIQVHQYDILPKKICQDCLDKLNMFSAFKDKSIKTEQLLCKIYKEFKHTNLNSNSNMQIYLEIPPRLLTDSFHDVSNIDISDLVNRDGSDSYNLIVPNQNEIHVNSLGLFQISNSNLNDQDLSNESLHTHQNNIPIIQTQAVQDFQNDNLNLIPQLLSDHFRLSNDIKFMAHMSLNEGNSIFTESSKSALPTCQDNNYTKKLVNLLDYSIPKNSLSVDSNLSESNLGADLEKHLSGIMSYTNDNQLENENNSDSNLLVDQEISNVSAVICENGDYLLEADNNHRGDLSDLSVYDCDSSKNLDSTQCALIEPCDNHLFKMKLDQELSHSDSKRNEEQKNTSTETLDDHQITLKNKLIQNSVNGIHVKSWNSLDCNNLDGVISVNGENNHLSIVKSTKGAIKQPIVPSKEKQEQQEKQIKIQKTIKECTECGKSYSSNYKLSEHMRKHTGERPFKCKTCEKTFRSKIGLAQHETKHTGQYEYLCSTCGKGFQCRSYLMVHQRAHSNLKPYPCSTCGQHFKTKQSLLDHTNRHLGLKPFACSKCDKKFATKALVKGHEQTHIGVDNKRYTCKTCNKRFVSKSYLSTHSRIHTGEKPFICEVCAKGFITRVDLKIHLTMHTGEKKYVCEMCGKAFARLDALKCHTRSHTGERPYTCEVCGRKFTQFTPMANHRRCHTGERPYKCETCGDRFVTKSTMLTHVKRHREKQNDVPTKMV